MDVTILGSGSPIPDAERAGPSGLVETGPYKFMVDCGRGVLIRLTGAGVMLPQITSVLLTHLHSDHTTDFNDIVTTWWVLPGTMDRRLQVIGPPGTQEFVDGTIAAMRADIGYRIEHHADINEPPVIDVTEVSDGIAFEADGVRIVARLVDHGVVRPAVGYRIEAGAAAACWPGDTLPCDGLDALARDADIYVQTVVRRSLVESIPIQRFLDILDYHSDLAGAGATAKRAGVKTLVLNHPVPAPAPGTEQEWIDEAAAEFDGHIVFAHDLLKLHA